MRIIDLEHLYFSIPLILSFSALVPDFVLPPTSMWSSLWEKDLLPDF